MRMRVLFGFGLAMMALPGLALAAPGDLDATFGGSGTVVTPVTAGFDTAWDVLVQSDGKIVTAGQARDVTTDFALLRHDADGTLDATFGSGGIVVTPLGAGDEIARGVVQQPDGKLVVVGYTNNGVNNDFAVVRYNADGSLDGTFGTGGIVTTPIGAGDNALGVALQADGKIVVAGYSSLTSIEPALARYNTDGSLDATFGTGGIVTVPLGPGTDTLSKVAIEADGKIVAAGYTSNAGVFQIAVLRLDADGNLDPTFDGDGTAITPVDTTYALATSLVLDGDGRITVAGYTRNVALDTDVAVVRYNADGSLDTTFDGDGKVQLALGAGNDQGRAMVREPSGKLVIAGLAHNGVDNALAVVKLNPDGSLDTSFGTGGVTTTDVSGSDAASGVALQADGKIVAAGFTGPVGTPDHLVVRYENAVCGDGTLDAGELCDAGAANGTPDSCCSATCTLVPAATVCRAAGDVCELDALCDGASPVCPANPAAPDGDADGDCDAIDACTTIDAGQVFATRPKSRVVLTRINSDAVPGNDGLVVSAFFALPPGRTFSELTPLADGVRVVLLSDDGDVRLDATLPAGAYSTATKVGWKLSGNGKTWRFTDRSATPVNGITQVVVNDKNTAKTPRRVKVTVKGKKGTYPVAGGDAPIQAIVTLGDAAAAEQGLCGESDYAPSSCLFNATQNKLTCRR